MMSGELIKSFLKQFDSREPVAKAKEPCPSDKSINECKSCEISN